MGLFIWAQKKPTVWLLSGLEVKIDVLRDGKPIEPAFEEGRAGRLADKKEVRVAPKYKSSTTVGLFIWAQKKPTVWLLSGLEVKIDVLRDGKPIEPAFEEGRAGRLADKKEVRVAPTVFTYGSTSKSNNFSIYQKSY